MTRPHWLTALAATCILAVCAEPARAANLASLAGTWVLNVAHSKFTPGSQIQRQTRLFDVNGDVVEQTTDSVDARGVEVHSHWTAHYDGKDYELEGNPDANTIAVEKTGELTAKTTLKKNGQIVQTVIRTLSADGKTCTFQYDGVNAKGRSIHNTLVFDKQD
jgi:hypothetical protein